MIAADNQQERLRLIGWLVGFSDGEGCFTISIFKNKTTALGYQVFPEFVITQGEKSKKSLEIFQNFFHCGKIYINRRYDNHKEHIYRYCVRSIKELREIIIPFFNRYPLQTKKKEDFEIFSQAVKMMTEHKHLKPSGFKKIIRLKSLINRKILRDYTSESLKKR